MYNRYVPRERTYAPARSGPEEVHNPKSKPSFGPLPDMDKLSGLLAGFHLEELDSGDILLVLILLLLLKEGDDLERLITLGLMLLMTFSEKKGADPNGECH